jgi:hypothetical protein
VTRRASFSGGRNYLANLHAVVGEPLTAQEMQAIAGIDRSRRLIEGQVFLWPEGRRWEDLWTWAM